MKVSDYKMPYNKRFFYGGNKLTLTGPSPLLGRGYRGLTGKYFSQGGTNG
jgi:hypothetical protein